MDNPDNKENYMRKFLKKLKMFKERANDNKGFTFVELLCASVILALIVAPALQLFLFATKTNSKARTELQADITASSVLESARSFSIYAYDAKCNADYSSVDPKTFTLLAGQYDGSGFKTLMELSDTSCYQVKFKSDNTDSDDYYVIESVSKQAGSIKTKGKTSGGGSKIDDDLAIGDRCRYAYVINGIKQTNNTYDAVVVFEKFKYQNLEISGNTFTESDVSWLSQYNKNFKITVLVYRAKDRGSDKSYIGKDVSKKNTALVRVEGSKLDPAMAPDEM